MRFLRGAASPENATTHTMRSTHRLDRLLTGTACRVGHRTPSSATAEQADILCHVSWQPLTRLSAAWRGRRSSAQHRLAIADARGARGFKSQCQRAPRLLLAFVFWHSPARMTTYFVLRIRLDSCTLTSRERAGIGSACQGAAERGQERGKTVRRAPCGKVKVFSV